MKSIIAGREIMALERRVSSAVVVNRPTIMITILWIRNVLMIAPKKLGNKRKRIHVS